MQNSTSRISFYMNVVAEKKRRRVPQMLPAISQFFTPPHGHTFLLRDRTRTGDKSSRVTMMEAGFALSLLK